MGMFENRYDKGKNQGGSSYLDWKSIEGDLKSKFWNPPKRGSSALDIVPFYIKTDKHPLVAVGDMKIGQPDFMLDIWVHRRVGVLGLDCVCLKMNYNKPCPICEYVSERIKAHGKEDDQYRALKAKRRVVFNVMDAESDDEEIKIFEVSHYLFAKELLEKAQIEGQRKGLGTYLDFADPFEGFSVVFRTNTEKFGEMDTVKFKDFSFEKRDYEIEDELMKEAIAFDELIVYRGYDELASILYNSDEGTSTDDEDDGPEEQPTPSRRKKKRPHVEAEEEDEINEDEDEEEEKAENPPVKKRSKPSKSTSKKPEESCPYDHEFGTDCDNFDDCDDCDVWEKCRATKKSK